MQQFALRQGYPMPLRIPILGLSHIGMVLALSFIFIGSSAFAQDADAQQLAFTQTKIQFEKELGAEHRGTGTYIYSTKDNNTIEAQYNFEKSSTPNPYQVSYSYNIQKSQDGSLVFDLKSVIDPSDMRIDESIEIKSSKDKVEYPANIKIGQRLNDVDGYISLYTKQGKAFLYYNVSISNREVLRKETISIGNSSIEAFVISYDYKFEKTNQNDMVLKESKQKVEEWYLPGVGIIKQNRSGEDVNKSLSEEEGSGAVNFNKSTSNIKHIDQY